MKWKKVCAGWLVLTLMAIMTMVPVYAADTSQSYTFTVTADALEQTMGDGSELTVSLSKDGGGDSYRLYASTVVLRFNGDLFQESGIQTAEGVTATVSDLSGSWEGWKAVTLNVLVSDLGNRDIIYIDFIFMDQMKQKIQRTLKNIKLHI